MCFSTLTQTTSRDLFTVDLSSCFTRLEYWPDGMAPLKTIENHWKSNNVLKKRRRLVRNPSKSNELVYSPGQVYIGKQIRAILFTCFMLETGGKAQSKNTSDSAWNDRKTFVVAYVCFGRVVKSASSHVAQIMCRPSLQPLHVPRLLLSSSACFNNEQINTRINNKKVNK